MSHTLARALALFDEYADMPPARRSLALETLRWTDPEVHAALLALIAADAGWHPLDEPLQAAILDQEPNEASAASLRNDERIGTRLGPSRIDRRIAEGGMGTVYEAHRDDGQFQQRVALKCTRIELASPGLMQAFLAERHNLAQLEHPGIGALLDGGVEPGGQPWFAMRYVEGEPIDEWCDARCSSLEKRIRLTLQACDALAYAHERGILHQDLKPSNLFVTDEGRVQLLDFGLSSALAGDTERTTAIAISPGYTAPELIASGAPPSVAADIYSLGMVICRLLCGSVPLVSLLAQAGLRSGDSDGSLDLESMALNAAPGTARKRGLENEAALARRLAGDLDAIVARCVAVEPGRRYRSVADLREDLSSWLDQRPVRARAGGAIYRSLTLLRRHRMAASLGAVALLSGAVGIGTAAWLDRRADQEAAATEAVARLFEETLGNATLSGLSDSTFSSKALLQRTEQQMRSLSLQDQPKVLGRALSTLARSYAVIGEYPHALELVSEAADLHDRGESPSADTQATLAALLNLQARHDEAQQVAREALSTLEGADEQSPVRLRLLTEIARSHWELGSYDQAKRELDGELALLSHDLDSDPAPHAELLTIRGYWNLRLSLFAAAEADLKKAIALAAPRHPQLANNARQVLVRVLVQLERTEESVRLAAQLLDSRRRTLGERHPDTGRAWVVLADSQCNAAQVDACAASIARGERIIRDTYGEQHPEYAEALQIAAFVYDVKGGTYENSLKNIRRAEAILSRAYSPTHEAVLRVRTDLSKRLLFPGRNLPQAERARLLEEGIVRLETLIADARQAKFQVTYAQILLGRRLTDGKRPDDLKRAEHLLEECLVEVERYYGRGHTLYLSTRFTQSYLKMRQGDPVEADAILQQLKPEILAQFSKAKARYIFCNVLLTRGIIAVTAGRGEAGRQLLNEALAESKRLLGPEHFLTITTKSVLEELDETGKIDPDRF
ncbi:protein kinase domain-containing protein [Lysobacter sp. CA196]|uniref:serine/threonine protein kinase n=1 Tax=Lysobacter sp. CA196 TaxID=3455606 RepID=UPI003F8D0726